MATVHTSAKNFTAEKLEEPDQNNKCTFGSYHWVKFVQGSKIRGFTRGFKPKLAIQLLRINQSQSDTCTYDQLRVKYAS